MVRDRRQSEWCWWRAGDQKEGGSEEEGEKKIIVYGIGTQNLANGLLLTYADLGNAYPHVEEVSPTNALHI